MTWIEIDRSSGISLYRQIYDCYRRKILQGEMRSGEQLPSTRELAANLQVSRNIVIEAYEQLLAEGYIEGRHGSGTYVAEGAYLEGIGGQAAPSPLSDALTGHEQRDIIHFRPGIPALDLFPRKLWGKLTEQIYNQAPHDAFGYGKPEGRHELRTAVTRYLRRTRGILCEPEQLLITTGATQALGLIAKLLLASGSEVIVEDPLTHEIHTIFKMPGAELLPIPVDEQGLLTQLLPHDRKPAFTYVTPSHQFPMGGVLPIQRRVQLIQFARATDSYIVEDDYDSEFRYDSAPISSLQGLDPERVIYIGTFSKIVSPALRIGYLILPPSLIERARDLKWLTDLHTPALEQLTLARFIEEGYLERHIAKMKKVYRKRRDFMVQTLQQRFGDNMRIMGSSTGLHLLAEFPGIEFTQDVLSKIEAYGVRVHPVEIHAIRKGTGHEHRILLGYGNVSEANIAEGIRRLAAALSAIQSL
ncbi:MocR-like pyridoxine biosynthesis transcription factor PdxR [Paenibacillus guangzhouensis]|uniref:MocR-like pyridoxine biosynthesis transcription factor PdxR n=1 Tax=Paenibacillus guangzhouensis TaxID=1473112 RepID=UPI00126782E2|nr:PLP-dependent aminotransferase family protein [Paenibacillus guangzhouensis]